MLLMKLKLKHVNKNIILMRTIHVCRKTREKILSAHNEKIKFEEYNNHYFNNMVAQNMMCTYKVKQ